MCGRNEPMCLLPLYPTKVKSPESVTRMKEREVGKEQTDDRVDLGTEMVRYLWHMNWCISMHYSIP